VFRPTLARAGIRRIRFHDLRHTYATLLINQGANIKYSRWDTPPSRSRWTAMGTSCRTRGEKRCRNWTA
jgi:integrase